MSVQRDQWSDELSTEDKEKKYDPENLPRTPLGQPALEPGKDHSGKKKIHHGERQEYHDGEGEQLRSGDSQADRDTEQPKAGDGSRRVQRAVSQADQKI